MIKQKLYSLYSSPYLWGALIAGTLLFNVFFLLGTKPISSWDEARHGVSAYEMLQSGNFVVNTYMGDFDYWNLKPPFAFYPMLAGFSLFGFTPFGLRFFSAVSTIVLFGILFMFSNKIGGLRTARLACATLLSVEQFFLKHNARTGDADAFFGLLYFASVVVLLYHWRKPVASYVAAFLAGMAFLTKSFHIIPLIPTIVIIFFLQWGCSKQSVMLFLRACLVGALPVVVWGLLRYQYDGFLFFITMIKVDVLNRSLTAVEGHGQPPLYYVAQVLKAFWPWLAATGLAYLALLFLHKKSDVIACWKSTITDKEKLLICLVVAAIMPIFFFSLSQSKLRWYSYPAFPFFALGIGYALHCALTCLKDHARVCFALLTLVVTFGVVQEGVLLAHLMQAVNKRVPSQDFMEQLGTNKEMQGAVLFLQQGEWEQRDVLSSYFYGPFTLAPGGEAAFAASNNPKKFLVPNEPTTDRER